MSSASRAIFPPVISGLMLNVLSTVKTYAVAISSCHKGFGERSVFAHPLVKRFLKGVRRQRPVTCPLEPQWDLPLVLCTPLQATSPDLSQVSVLEDSAPPPPPPPL